MKKYADLIHQTFEFPSKEFKLVNGQLHFHRADLMQLIKIYGTPLKLTYLPKIKENIIYTEKIFNQAIQKYQYDGSYHFAYCTKSSHFRFVIEEALKAGSHLETSSAFDIPIVMSMYNTGKLTKSHYLICNGYKPFAYLKNITQLINGGFHNCIPILDNLNELSAIQQQVKKDFQIGIRIASDEEPNFAFYTSRLGIRYGDIVPYYNESIRGSNAKLKMLHYFINTGIRDSAYYWSELNRFMYKYCEIKKVCPELDTVDIGGGLPIKNSLAFEFDYAYMAQQIIENIQWVCKKNHVSVPNIFTEFGSYTVGESGAVLYSVLDQKLQNDKELWYMMDGSFITHMPDVWGKNEKFILLPINHWNNEYHKVNLGGLTCDSMDYYDSEAHIAEVFLPRFNSHETLFFGFFHTGAYQESIGGYGGIQHCLIPSPKHILVGHDKNHHMTHQLFAHAQQSDKMMELLGYNH